MSKDLGVLVRTELYKRNMKMKDLAELIGVSPAYLSDIVRGKRDGEKAQEHVKKIKKILDIKETLKVEINS